MIAARLGICVGLLLAPLVSPLAAQHPATARISVPNVGGVYSLGSGVLVHCSDEHGYVLTNWHVVRDAVGNPRVTFADGFQSNGRVLDVDPTWDLAVVKIFRPPAEPVELAERTPQRGDRLTVAGFGGGSYRESAGECSGYVMPTSATTAECVVVSTSVRSGDSGGPIFDDEGRLAGLLWGCADGSTYGTYCGRISQFAQRSGCINGWCAPRRAQPSGRQVSPIVSAPPLKPVPGPAGPPGPIGPAGPKGDRGVASEDESNQLRELTIAVQRITGDTEALRRLAEAAEKRLDLLETGQRDTAIVGQRIASANEATLRRLEILEKRMSGQLKFKLKFDPATGSLTPVE